MAKKQRTKQGSTKTRKLAAAAIDRDKLRAAVRRLGDEYVFQMLESDPDDANTATNPVLISSRF